MSGKEVCVLCEENHFSLAKQILGDRRFTEELGVATVTCIRYDGQAFNLIDRQAIAGIIVEVHFEEEGSIHGLAAYAAAVAEGVPAIHGSIGDALLFQQARDELYQEMMKSRVLM